MTLSSDEVWKKVEEERLADERRREPFLVAFRAQSEEIELRRSKDGASFVKDKSEIECLAERIAERGNEAIRFEQYLIQQGFYPVISPDDSYGKGSLNA